MRIEFVFAYISTFSVLIPLGLSVFQFRKLRDGMRYLFYLLIGSCLADVAAYILSKNQINTYTIANAYLLYQFVILALIFSFEFNNSKLIKYTIITFFIFFVCNILAIQGILVFNTHSNSVA